MAAVFALTVGLLVTAILWAVIRRAPEVSEACRVSEVEDGLVEVEGALEACGALRAPLSGRAAAAWEVVVEREEGLFSWRPVVVVSSAEALAVVDDSGRIELAVPPEQLRVSAPALSGRAGPFRAPPPAVLRLLRRRRCDPRGVIFCRGFRWSERVLRPGDHVRVRGVAQWTTLAPSASAAGRPGGRGTGGYRGLETNAVLRAQAGQPVQIKTVARGPSPESAPRR